MAVSPLFVLNPADLEANRANRITPEQRRNFASAERGFRKDRLALALVFAALAVVLGTASGPAPNAWLRPAAAAAFGLIALALLFGGLIWVDSLTRDLSSGEVRSVEGALGKHSWSSSSGTGSGSTIYELQIGGSRFHVGSLTYERTPDAGWFRLYFMPRSRKVVNLEQLPDKAVPNPLELVGSGPGAAVQMLEQLGGAAFSGNSEAMAEFRAEGAAMKRAMDASLASAATPPAPSQLDKRPLAEAIVGTWQLGMMTATFHADGTVAATMAGREQRGSWSIGADGKLRASGLAGGETADAWVSGDVLTVSQAGRGLQFHRVPG